LVPIPNAIQRALNRSPSCRPASPSNYLTPALAASGLAHVRWHDLRHALAVMSLSAGSTTWRCRTCSGTPR